MGVDASFRPSRRLLGQLSPSASGSAPLSTPQPAEPRPPSARAARRVLDRPSETLAVPAELPNRRPGQPPLTAPPVRSQRTYLSALPAGRCSLHNRVQPPPPRSGTPPRGLRRGKSPGVPPLWAPANGSTNVSRAQPIRDDQVEWAGRKEAAGWKLPEGPASSGRASSHQPFGQGPGAHPLR